LGNTRQLARIETNPGQPARQKGGLFYSSSCSFTSPAAYWSASRFQPTIGVIDHSEVKSFPLFSGFAQWYEEIQQLRSQNPIGTIHV
jgi:hypothetical protein